MNLIYCSGMSFSDSDEGNVSGKILDGSFYLENSLAEDELSVDTLDFRVRYPLDGTVDTKPITIPYGTSCVYMRDNSSVGAGLFFVKHVERLSRFEYAFHCQSAIGLLDDTTHYGGIYQGDFASDVIADIIGDKITYTTKEVFSRIKLYGWLPIATRRENLKQVLFACGGCVKKDSSGSVYITTLDTTTPIDVPDSRVLEGGKISYDTEINKVEVTEHGYIKSDNTPIESAFEGELSGQTFTTPKGFEVKNAALVTWDKPFHSLTFDGCTVLNDEIGPNYAIVRATPNAVIKGKPYVHTEAIVHKNKSGAKGREKVATVEDATLVSLANSGSTAERVLAYYGNSNTLSTSIVLNGETTTNTIQLTDPFGDKATGFIKSIDGDMSKNVSTADIDVVLNYKPPTVVGSRTLVSIAVTKKPNQTNYASGDYFNAEGMVVTATYDDGTTDILNNYSYTPSERLQESDTEIVITYTELGVTATTKLPISVVTLLRRIAITTPPDNTDYYEDDEFNPLGMVVTAYYSDGSSKIVTDYSYSPTGPLSKTDETITITYSDTGVTVTTYQDITVGDAPNLTGIKVTQNPNKMTYRLGDLFNPEGMIVTAYFDNGTSKPIKGYTYTPAGALTKDDTVITISYSKRGVTKTDTLNITVFYLTSIEITNPPTYTEYYEGNNFNKAGMEITAHYSNNTTSILDANAYSVTPVSLVDKDDHVTISYTEQGITCTAVQPINVTYYPYDYTKSKVITTSGTYHLSDLGATHRNLRIVSISGGNGGQGGTNGGSGWGSNSVYLNSGTGSKSSQPGSGGQGGTGGGPVEGGKFISQELVLDTANDDIVINIGIGGKGGVNGAAGEIGGDTTCVIGDNNISSADGSSNTQGFVDIFTQQKYALGGVAGFDGARGGSGGGSGSGGNSGSSTDTHNGGSGGGNHESSQNQTKIENPPMQKSTTKGQKVTKVSAGDMTQKWSGPSSYSVNSEGIISTSGYSNIGYKDTFTAKHTIPKPYGPEEVVTKQMNHYNPGTIYTNLRNDKAPNHANGTYYSEVTEMRCNVGDQNWYQSLYMNTQHQGTTEQKITVKRVYVYKEHARTLTTGWGGGGGGGASAASGGESGGYYNGSNVGNGGRGGPAPAAAVPDAASYGSSGNSGSGGGGGGGAGAAYCAIQGDNSYQASSVSASGKRGGSGGAGSPGSDGNQGCVIIYYS